MQKLWNGNMNVGLALQFRIRSVDLQYQRRMSKVFGFLFTLAMVLHCGNNLDWQGTGNMSSDNITQISNYINGNFQKSWPYTTLLGSTDTTLVNFAQGFSDHLNLRWDKAWNVVVAYITDGSNADTVLYGYAFRDHWMWMNGNKMDDNHYVSFIIWKDYNCITWFTFNYNTADRVTNKFPGSFASVINSNIQSTIFHAYTQLNQNDVWSAAKRFSDDIAGTPNAPGVLGSNTAISVIASQKNAAAFFGKFCAKNYLADYMIVGNQPAGNWGAALIMQMR